MGGGRAGQCRGRGGEVEGLDTEGLDAGNGTFISPHLNVRLPLC